MSPAPENPLRPWPGRVVDWLERRMALSELFSFVTHFGFIWTRIDPNRPVREVVREAANVPVERYAMWPRAFGLFVAVLFLLELVTGTLLALHYQPASEAAYGSARSIVRDVPFGWLLHQLHAWGAWMLVLVAIVRLLRLFWDGLYRAPRELLWLSAVALVILALKMDFTGRLLTWDTVSYWSVTRGLDVLVALPLLGPLLQFLMGGHVVNDGVLTRFYVFHVVILPFWFAAAIYLTFATLRRVGLSPVEGSAPATTTIREHAVTMVSLLLVVFAVLVTLVVLVPFPFRGPADPYVTPEGVRPPWYLLAPHALMIGLGLPAWIPGLLVLAAGIGLALLPLWLARHPDRFPERRVRLAGIVVLALWVALTVLGFWMEGRS